jgi:hypothetical protein
MDSTEKTVLIVGGVGLIGILLFSFLKQQAANALAASNQPGLTYQPSVPAAPPSTLDSILSGVTIGSSALGSIFSGISSIGTSNDPGLESGEDDIAYQSDPDAYSYAGANSYSGLNGDVTGNSSLDASSAADFLD